MKDEMRKSDSLVSSALRIREDMKNVRGKYNDNVSDLARLAKGELKKLASELKSKKTIENIDDGLKLFDKLEETMLSLEKYQSAMDEIVTVVGGLEFSSESTSLKFAELLSEQEKQQSRMTKAVSMMAGDLESLKNGNDSVVERLVDDITEFMHDFTRFQDYMIDAESKVGDLFNLLDKEEQAGIRYKEQV